MLPVKSPHGLCLCGRGYHPDGMSGIGPVLASVQLGWVRRENSACSAVQPDEHWFFSLDGVLDLFFAVLT